VMFGCARHGMRPTRWTAVVRWRP